MEYNIHKPWLSLDQWQKDYISCDTNSFLLCSRQSGKTAAASIKFGQRAALKPNQIIMMVAFTEKQAYNLFFKTLMYLEAVYPKMICKGNKKPTKHEINLKNGSKIMCYAAGLTGDGLRTFTLTSLVIDEAAPMAREIFIACSPMLSVTGGTMDLLSTPKGSLGYFYECSDQCPNVKKGWTRFYVSAEDCPRHSKEFLESEKISMSESEYAQEYLAIFLKDVRRVFTTEWLKKVCHLKRPDRTRKERDYYLGVDIARMGRDSSTFEVLERLEDGTLQQVENIVTKKTLTTDTEDRILQMEDQYDFRKIYIDAGAGSLGVGIFDHLLRQDETKTKVVAINNRARPMDRDGKSKTKLLKEDLYNNLVALGNRNMLHLLDDEDLIESLRNVQFEFVIRKGRPTSVRFFGDESHIAEGLTRAAWCSKEKNLKPYVSYI